MLAAGFTLQYTAIGTFSDSTTQDLTNQVTWIRPTEPLQPFQMPPAVKD